MKKLFLLFVLLSIVLMANRGQATTYTTTTFTDFPITPGTGGINANTGQIIGGTGNGQVSVRSAIVASNFKGGSNVINLANGTYLLTQGPYDDEFNTFGGVMETGDLDIIDLQIAGFPRLASVTFNGAGRDTTIIQMGTLVPAAGGTNNINKDRVLEVNDPVIPQVATHVTLNNLTIQGGVAPRTPDPDHYFTPGGGIKYDGFDSATGLSSGVLTLNNCKVTGNQSAGPGGGINAIFCSLVIQGNSIISFNTNQFAAGGGILYVGGNTIDSPPQTVTIRDSFITNNVAADATFGSGGGLFTTGGGGMTITNTLFAGNIAGIATGANGGGGLHIASMPAATIVNSIIRSNSCKLNGGGLWCSPRNIISNAGGTNTLSGVTITGNTADSDNNGSGNGGGIYHFFGTLIIQGASHIDGNSAVNGGGIFTTWSGISGDPSASLTVNGGTIGQSGSGNIAKMSGGAVAVAPGAATTFGTVSLNTVTMVGNSAVTSGGAAFITSGSMNMGFSRVVSNTAPTGRAVARTGGTVTVTNNWWGTNAPAALMSGTVGFTPWLQLTHLANPNTIFIPNSTTLTATFLTNSAGTFIPVANLSLLVGLPITFSNPVRGTLSGAQTVIQASGLATATFTANTAGAGSADATVDGGTATASITIPTGVSSINRVQTSPTNLASVQWTVTFTNAVSGVNAANFSLANVGLGGAPAITSVIAVGGSPATSWTVTANTGSGTGTLGLNMVSGVGVSAVIVNLAFTGQIYTIDLVAPNTTITAQPASLTNVATASFSFTASDVGVGVSNIQCQLDGAAYTNCTSPVNFSGLSSASHTFNVRAIDGVGNTDASPATVTWTVDTIPPTVNCSGDLNVTANGYCPPTVNYSVSVSDNLAISLATTNPASGSVFPLGTNLVTLTARDTAGNTNFCTFKVIVAPGAAPQLNIIRSGTNVVVSWTNLFPCYTLQFAPVLVSNSWSSYPGPFTTNGGSIYVTNGVAITNRFYRLSF